MNVKPNLTMIELGCAGLAVGRAALGLKPVNLGDLMLARQGLTELFNLKLHDHQTFEALTSLRNDVISMRDRGDAVVSDEVIRRIDEIRAELERAASGEGAR